MTQLCTLFIDLEHFDTILAFTAAMAGFSLIVTALSQAVSGLLGLRGLILKWGLEKLFATLTAQGEAPFAASGQAQGARPPHSPSS